MKTSKLYNLVLLYIFVLLTPTVFAGQFTYKQTEGIDESITLHSPKDDQSDYIYDWADSNLEFEDELSMIKAGTSMSISVGTSTLCSGVETTVTYSWNLGSSPQGYAQYSLDGITWYNMNAGPLATISSGVAKTISPTVSTTYYGRVMGNLGVLQLTATPRTITVNPSPSNPTSVTATPSTICTGSSSNLRAVSAGNTIRWWSASTGGAMYGTSASGANYPVSPTNTTTYYAESMNSGLSNIGVSASASHTDGGSGPYGPTEYNNGSISNCPDQPWGWVKAGEDIVYTWGSQQTVNTVRFHKGDRPFSSLYIHYWNGSNYVYITTYSNSSACSTVSGGYHEVTFPPVSTTRIRFSNILGSNPNFREIEVFGPPASCPSLNRVPVTVTVQQPPTAPTGITGTTTICNGQSTTLTAEGGSDGSGANVNWYSGACGPVFSQEWFTLPYGTAGTTLNSVNGILDVTSTNGDPMIMMYGLGSFNPNIYKHIQIRYRVVSGTAGNTEIFFTNGLHGTAHGSQMVSGSMNSDGNWHILNIDMSTHGNWTHSNITGWRYDWATQSGARVQIDYIALGEGQAVGQGNSIVISPTSNTTYYVQRVGTTTCSNATACASTTVIINTPPTAPTSIAGVNTICSGQTTELTATGGDVGDGCTYQWGTGLNIGENIIVGATEAIYETQQLYTSTNYWVRRIGTAPCDGTTTGGVTQLVTVDPLPEASAGGSAIICETGNHTVSGASASNGTILWTHNGSGSISNATTLAPTYSASSGDAGNIVTLTMTVTSNNSCGTATDTDTYTLIPLRLSHYPRQLREVQHQFVKPAIIPLAEQVQIMELYYGHIMVPALFPMKPL